MRKASVRPRAGLFRAGAVSQAAPRRRAPDRPPRAPAAPARQPAKAPRALWRSPAASWHTPLADRGWCIRGAAAWDTISALALSAGLVAVAPLLAARRATGRADAQPRRRRSCRSARPTSPSRCARACSSSAARRRPAAPSSSRASTSSTIAIDRSALPRAAARDRPLGPVTAVATFDKRYGCVLVK